MSGAELKDKDTEAAREEITHHPGHCPDYPDYSVWGSGFRERRPGWQSADQCVCSGQAHKLACVTLSVLVYLKISTKKRTLGK